MPFNKWKELPLMTLFTKGSGADRTDTFIARLNEANVTEALSMIDTMPNTDRARDALVARCIVLATNLRQLLEVAEKLREKIGNTQFVNPLTPYREVIGNRFIELIKESDPTFHRILDLVKDTRPYMTYETNKELAKLALEAAKSASNFFAILDRDVFFSHHTEIWDAAYCSFLRTPATLGELAPIARRMNQHLPESFKESLRAALNIKVSLVAQAELRT